MGKKLFIVLVGLLFGGFTVLFNFFPRSTVSELEKRELAKFPTYSGEKLADGSFAKEISLWFSDSEPYRDFFISMSMGLKDLIRVNFSKESSLTFHAPDMTDNDYSPTGDFGEDEA